MSINHFSRNSDGSVDWANVPEDLVLETADSDVAEAESLIVKYLPDSGHFIIFWGSLALPTVEIDCPELNPCIHDVLEQKPEFWIYIPSRGVLVESAFSGLVTIAQVPV